MGRFKKKFKATKIDVDKITNSKYFIPDLNLNWQSYNLSWFDIETTQNYLYENVNKEKTNNVVLRAKSVDLKLNESQANIIKQWIESARIIYNITVKYFRKNKLCSLISVRKEIYKLIPQMIKNCKIPHHIIDNAINDVIKAHNSCIGLLKAKCITKYQIKYKKITKNKQTIVIEKHCFSKTKNSFYVRSLNEIKSSMPFTNMEYDTRLSYDKLKNKFTLYVPMNKTCKEINNRQELCSIDPGNKTFLTCYNPDGSCIKICNRDAKQKISKLVKRKLLLKELYNNTKLRRHKNAMLKNNRKIMNAVKELHYKASMFLCLNYNVIYLGKISTTSITNKKNSNLTDEEKEFTYVMSHYQFRTILTNKCEEFGVALKVVDESYTSKTCGACGFIKNDIKGNRIFECDQCNSIIDRDLNGARNILIKNT